MISRPITVAVGVLILSCSFSFGEDKGPVLIDAGPHERTWEYAEQITTEDGVVFSTNRYVELQTGLNRLTEQGWVETSPQIELFNGGAVARQLQYSVIFLPNLASRGAIDLSLPDGGRLTGQPVGLAYMDGAKSVWVGLVKDCVGELGGEQQNSITFHDVFDGCDADIRFSVERASFSQDLILNTRLPSPRDYGLADDAQLALVTEWITAPAPKIERRVWQEAAAGQLALTDDAINLGAMEFIVGKAFSFGEVANAVTVAKGWDVIDGRTFFAEKVLWKQIEPEMAKLPPPQAALKRSEARNDALLAKNVLPVPAQARRGIKPIQLARVNPRPEHGYVWDFTLISSASNTVLRADTTYLVTGTVNLSGVTTLEGSCCIKCTNSTAAQINITGNGAQLLCLTEPSKPAWFTSRDDNSVGDTIPGSSGNPSAYCANTMLYLDSATSGVAYNLQHLRFAYANTAVNFNSTSGGTPPVHTLSHAQFIKSGTGISMANGDVRVRNVLASAVDTIFNDNSAPLRVENLTAHRINRLGWIYYNTLYLTNSLLVQVTNMPSYTGNYNFLTSDDTGIFQTLGAGAHYLPWGSPYRYAGTSTVTPSLLADFGNRTTFAPVELTNDFTNFTVISASVPRGTSLGVDVGYYCEAVDAAWTGRSLSSTLLLTNGAAVAIYGPRGIILQSGSQFISEGSPTNLNRLVRYQTVQENLPWSTNGATMSFFAITNTPATAPTVYLRFTDVAQMAESNARHHLLDNGAYRFNLGLQDCVLRNAYVYVFPSDGSQIKNLALTNWRFLNRWRRQEHSSWLICILSNLLRICSAILLRAEFRL